MPKQIEGKVRIAIGEKLDPNNEENISLIFFANQGMFTTAAHISKEHLVDAINGFTVPCMIQGYLTCGQPIDDKTKTEY